MDRIGPGIVPGGLRPRLSPARLRTAVAQAPRAEITEGRPGRWRLLLAPPQLHRRLYDRDRRRIGVPAAPGGARRPPVAADDRIQPRRDVLASRHRAAGTKQPGGDDRPRRGP